MLSSSSYVSSTGECSMMGISIRGKQKLFFLHNFEQMKHEAAYGGGEYLNSFKSLSGCEPAKDGRFEKLLQENFSEIFTENEAVYFFLESENKLIKLIEENSKPSILCKS